MRFTILYTLLFFLAILMPVLPIEAAEIPSPASIPAENAKQSGRPVASRVLFIGDSMTGWLGERMNAYGVENGYDVATIVWDGSTIRKWGSKSARLQEYVDKLQPDVIFISLGLNELAERNPQSQLASSLKSILKAAGDVPVIWVGPPSWPGKSFGETLDTWLAGQLGNGHYYSSLDLTLARQSKTNPHPSRAGIDKWVDTLMLWLPEHGAVALPGYAVPPASKAHSRGKTFIYRRMKESL